LFEILKGYFRLTPEDYRLKFRGITRKVEESYTQFSTRLANSFDKWMLAKDAADNVDIMRFCLLMESFMQATDDGLANHILDKNPTTIAEAAGYADTYVSRRSIVRNMTKESAGEKKWVKHRSHSAFGRNRNRNWDRNRKKPNPPANANTKPQTPPY
jgi:hypothetical protein